MASYLTWPFDSNLPFKRWKYAAALLTMLLNARLWLRSIEAIRMRRGFFSVDVEYETTRATHRWWLGLWLVPVITVGVGVVPLIVLTYTSGTLWLSSRVDSPLIAVPSVLIGDSFLLPILNLRIVRYLSVCLGISTVRSVLQRRLWVALFSASLVAAYTNYKWTHDSYFGFIDPTFGKLSLAGWWHLGFSIAEMTIIFSFVLIWAYMAKHRSDEEVQQLAVAAWQAFFPYVLLSLADFLILHLYLLPATQRGGSTPVTRVGGVVWWFRSGPVAAVCGWTPRHPPPAPCSDKRANLISLASHGAERFDGYATSTSSSPCTFVRATSVACAQLPRNTTVTRPCVLLPVES